MFKLHQKIDAFFKTSAVFLRSRSFPESHATLFFTLPNIWPSDLWLEESISNWRIAIRHSGVWPNCPVFDSFVENFRIETLAFVNHADAKICARPLAAMKWNRESQKPCKEHITSVSDIFMHHTTSVAKNSCHIFNTNLQSHTSHICVWQKDYGHTSNATKVCKWYQVLAVEFLPWNRGSILLW